MYLLISSIMGEEGNMSFYHTGMFLLTILSWRCSPSDERELYTNATIKLHNTDEYFPVTISSYLCRKERVNVYITAVFFLSLMVLPRSLVRYCGYSFLLLVTAMTVASCRILAFSRASSAQAKPKKNVSGKHEIGNDKEKTSNNRYERILQFYR